MHSSKWHYIHIHCHGSSGNKISLMQLGMTKELLWSATEARVPLRFSLHDVNIHSSFGL
jgi:hypothetical protein